MSELTRSTKVSVEEARDRVLAQLGRMRGPMLIGEACLLLGDYWTLRHAESLMLSMVKSGLLRHTTPEENLRFCIIDGFFLV